MIYVAKWSVVAILGIWAVCFLSIMAKKRADPWDLIAGVIVLAWLIVAPIVWWQA